MIDHVKTAIAPRIVRAGDIDQARKFAHRIIAQEANDLDDLCAARINGNLAAFITKGHDINRIHGFA